MRKFITIDQDMLDDKIVEAIRMRETEIAEYEISERNFELILKSYADLGDWPPEFSKFKGKHPDEAAKALDGINLDLVNKHLHRDQVMAMLKSSRRERNKSELAYQAILNSISEERLLAALARRS